MKFRRKIMDIEAEPVKVPEIIQTPHGSVMGKVGDWKAMDSEGMAYPIRKDIFKETYMPVDEEAKQMWKWVYNENYEGDSEENDSIKGE